LLASARCSRIAHLRVLMRTSLIGYSDRSLIRFSTPHQSEKERKEARMKGTGAVDGYRRRRHKSGILKACNFQRIIRRLPRQVDKNSRERADECARAHIDPYFNGGSFSRRFIFAEFLSVFLLFLRSSRPISLKRSI